MLMNLCKHSSKICDSLCKMTQGVVVRQIAVYITAKFQQPVSLSSLSGSFRNSLPGKGQKGLTMPGICDKFTSFKSNDEDTLFRKEFQRGLKILVKCAQSPAEKDTTSELRGGNATPGTPVKASMSGSVLRGNQGGTVEYFVSHP